MTPPLYRCTRCTWRGPRSATVQRVAAAGTALHCFCPRCLHPARRGDRRGGSRPGPHGRTDQVLTADRPDAPRVCTRCGFSGFVRDFPASMARGKLRVRTWCRSCTTEYYRERKAKKGTVTP